MNLLEIATHCAETIGLTDNLTITQAKKFARLRWKMICDQVNWRQLRREVLGSVPANTEEVVLPDDVELVLGVRIGGNRELLPSSDLSQLAMDPAGFGASGATLSFSPGPKNTAGRATIRLHRPLSQDTQVLLLCKLKCPALDNDSDTPLIAGVAQCLCAFTLVDLYRWMRQFSKAEAMTQEATAHLARMVDLETSQAATVARFIPYVEPGYDGSDWLTSKS